MNFVKFLKTSFTRSASGRLPLYILLEAFHTEALHNVRLLGFKTHKILSTFALRIHHSISPDVLLYITDNITRRFVFKINDQEYGFTNVKNTFTFRENQRLSRVDFEFPTFNQNFKIVRFTADAYVEAAFGTALSKRRSEIFHKIHRKTPLLEYLFLINCKLEAPDTGAFV